MPIPIWISIDWDYFVRSLHEWDWGHQESPFYQGGAMWAIRASQALVGGVDLREEMSPKRHAVPRPEAFWSVLEQLGYDFSRCGHFIVSDSHAGAGPVFHEIGHREEPAGLLVNFDAHHDLGYKGWEQSEIAIEAEKCYCDMWLCAVLCWVPELKARVVYPPWQTTKDLEWERKQIRENLPAAMHKRVRADLFLRDEAVSRIAKPAKGKTFDVKAVYICRSSAWTPPWLDQAFIDFVEDGERALDLEAFNPFLREERDIDPIEVRSDFRWEDAEAQAAQMKAMMELGPEDLRKMIEKSKD